MDFVALPERDVQKSRQNHLVEFKGRETWHDNHNGTNDWR